MVALSKFDAAVLLAAAGCRKDGVGEGLAVSDTFTTGAVARSFQTCSLQFRCDRSCCKEVENLQSRISFATDAVARGKLAYSDSDATGAVS